MSKKKNIIQVKGATITVFHFKENDFISLTDIAKTKENDSRAADIIKNWIRNRSTIEFIGTWEQLYNPDFKVVEFDHFKMNAGLPSFVLSPGNWVEKTNAIDGLPQSERLTKLNQIAISQMSILLQHHTPLLHPKNTDDEL